ncbi:hypothetical protein QBC47DRAFT_382222 [Echria macrotheca]|uniref:Uncharacterized protein n=1 Tax=Echria macrotheca TaxID=438768 RepID=A0AAJ0BBG0_9PEZI|nr:hypothetical protein QBC47DRAFT_382222 [Echria macrotheca]
MFSSFCFSSSSFSYLSSFSSSNSSSSYSSSPYSSSYFYSSFSSFSSALCHCLHLRLRLPSLLTTHHRHVHPQLPSSATIASHTGHRRDPTRARGFQTMDMTVDSFVSWMARKILSIVCHDNTWHLSSATWDNVPAMPVRASHRTRQAESQTAPNETTYKAYHRRTIVLKLPSPPGASWSTGPGWWDSIHPPWHVRGGQGG